MLPRAGPALLGSAFRSSPMTERLLAPGSDPDEEDLPVEQGSSGPGCGEVERLYRNRSQALVRHFAKHSGDGDAALDMVHEAFARFSALGTARRRALIRPDSYLFRICSNLFRDRARGPRHVEWSEDMANAAGSHDGVAALESRDALRRVEAAMLRLNPKTREIFMARRLDGMSYAEIAERTGLSVKGVEKHMSKAVATIDRLVHRD